MGIIRSLDEWEVGVGEGIGDYIQDTLTGTANFICGLRAKYPNSFFDRSFGRGLANSICSSVGVPPAQIEPPPFLGGQCEDGIYDVGCEWDGEVRANARVTGKVTTVVCEQSGRNFYTVEVNTGLPNAATGGNFSSLPIDRNHSGISITRAGGLPDDCGNASPDFPPDPTRDPNDFNQTITVSDYDADGNVTDSTEVSISLDDQDSYNFPVCVDVDGTRVCLGLDGFSTNDPPPSGEDDTDTGDNTPPPPPVELEEEEKEEEEEEEELDERIRYVAIDITSEPVNGKTILQSDEQNNDYFAGYFCWLIETPGGIYAMGQQPVRKLKTIFMAPAVVAGYRMYAVNGAMLKATTYKEPVEE